MSYKIKQPSMSRTGKCRFKSLIPNFPQSVSPVLSKIDLNKKERRRLLRSIAEGKIDCDFQEALYWLDDKQNIKEGAKVLGKGSYGIVFSGCPDNQCKNKVAVKAITISESILYDVHHPVSIEISFLEELRELYKKDITPHMTLLFFHFFCSLMPNFIDDVHSDDSDDDSDDSDDDSDNDDDKLISWKEEAQELYLDGLINDEIAILVTELANTDVYKLLMDDKNPLTKLQWEVLLFQVMHIIATLQYHLPGFRHNDFKINNILANTYKPKDGDYIVYKMFGKEFYVPDIGIQLMAWDFDFAGSHKHRNARHTDNFYKNFGCNEDANPVYDIHLFLNSILIYAPNSIHKDILPFFETALVDDISGNNSLYTIHGRLTKYKSTRDPDNTTYIPPSLKTPSEYLLFDSIFNKFRNKPRKSINVISKYDTKIKKYSKIKNRKDMFK